MLTLFLLRKNKYFFGKAFFKPFRKAFTKLLRKVLSKKFHIIASLKERFVIKGSKVLIMGLTYKENVADTRESPVREIVKELKEFGVEVYGYDPLLSGEEIEKFWVKALSFSFSTGFLFSKKKKCKVDCVIVAVAHEEFKKINLKDMKELMNNAPVLIDVRGMFDGEEAKRKGFYYRRL